MGKWEQVGSYPGYFPSHGFGTVVVDGKAYVSAQSADGVSMSEFDPMTGTWKARRSAPYFGEFIGYFSTQGRLYALRPSPYADSTYLFYYDPRIDFWNDQGLAPIPAQVPVDHGETASNAIFSIDLGSKVYIHYTSGMYENTENVLWEYDAAKDKWTRTTPYPEYCLTFNLAAGINNEKIYVINGSAPNHIMMFDPGSSSWTSLPTSADAANKPERYAKSVVFTYNDIFYIFTNKEGSGGTDLVSQYNVRTGQWQTLEVLPDFISPLTPGFTFQINGHFYLHDGNRNVWRYTPSDLIGR